MTAKKIWAIVITVVILVGIIFGAKLYLADKTKADEISAKDAEALVNNEFDKIAATPIMKYVAQKNSITVDNISYGSQKDIILDCSAKTIDIHKVVSPYYNEFLSSDEKKSNGTMFKSALDFKLEFQNKILDLVKNSEEFEIKIQVTLYEVEGKPIVYFAPETVDAIYGGVLKIEDEVSQIKKVISSDGSEKSIESGNVNKGLVSNFDLRYESHKPDTSNSIMRFWNSLKEDFDKNFIKHDRWKTILKGLWVTIKLTLCSLLIGIVLGFLVAFVRCTRLKNQKCGIVTKILDKVCGCYLTVIRGTPVVVQIMIIYFVIFMPMGVDKFLAAVICFGLNSGAYVAEIVRGGIMSIDDGQSEAGRSLGFGYMATMWHIVFPQAFKAVLPALANEFVVLLKETSIAFYIGLGDLMYAGNAIRAATYSAFMPLIAVAVIYLVMVLALSKLVGILERRLRNSER